MMRSPLNIIKIIVLPASALVGYTTYRYIDENKGRSRNFNNNVVDKEQLERISRYDSNYFKVKSFRDEIKQKISQEETIKSLFSFEDSIHSEHAEFKVNSFKELVNFINRGSFQIFDYGKTFVENLNSLDSRLKSPEVKAILEELDSHDIKNNAYSSFIQFFKIMYFEMLKETDNLQDIYHTYRPLLQEVTQNDIYKQEDLSEENKQTFCSDLDVLFSSTMIKVRNAKQMQVLFTNKSLLSHIYHFDFSNVDESFKLEDCPDIEQRCTFVFKHSPKKDLNMDLFLGIEKFSGLKEIVLGYVSNDKSPRVNFGKLQKNVDSLVAIGYKLTDSDLSDLSKSQIKEIVMTDLGTIYDFSIFNKIKTLKNLYIYNSYKKTDKQYFESKFKQANFTHPIRVYIKKDFLSPPSVFLLGQLD